jgi:hypothetical protein
MQLAKPHCLPPRRTRTKERETKLNCFAVRQHTPTVEAFHESHVDLVAKGIVSLTPLLANNHDCRPIAPRRRGAELGWALGEIDLGFKSGNNLGSWLTSPAIL